MGALALLHRPMFRAILELLVTILFAMLIRAVVSGLLKGFTSFSRSAAPPPEPPRPSRPSAPQGPQIAGELHRDPVCGTFVAESSPYRRGAGQQTFYYCSESCREKHSLVAR